MNYKETLFFVGKCLTINHEEHNRILVEEEIKSKKVDWDNVVKVSTAHYVFPALYCNLKRANFLHYLPSDLVEYMQHITSLNRERNQQIIEQAKELNEFLLANNIKPIFLKGTAFLLQGLYEDIAERMVGDIDFLVDSKEFKKTIELTQQFGYSVFHKDKVDNTILNRHYPKMTKKDRIASIEIHYKMVSNKSYRKFNYQFIGDSIKKIGSLNFLSNENDILMTCINHQLNNYNYLYYNISFRSSYDLFLLSKKALPHKAISNMDINLNLNNFLFSSHFLLGKILSIDFLKNKKSEKYYKKVLFFIENPKKRKSEQKKINTKLLWSNRINIIINSFSNKKYRKYLLERIKPTL